MLGNVLEVSSPTGGGGGIFFLVRHLQDFPVFLLAAMLTNCWFHPLNSKDYLLFFVIHA